MLSALMAAPQPAGGTTHAGTPQPAPKEVSLTSDRLTPELLWEMGRVGEFTTSPDGRLVEAVEIPNNRFFVGVQFHPEFKSRPNAAHPLFRAFVRAARVRAAARNPLLRD